MASAVAQAYAKYQVQNLAQSFSGEANDALLGFNDEEEEFDEENQRRNEDRDFQRSIYTKAVLAAAIGSLGLHVLLMAVFGGATMVVAGLIASAVAVTVSVREVRMENMDTLRDVHNGIRQDVNRFAGENTKLTKSIDELDTQVSSLKETEQRLKDITGDQELQVGKLVGLLEQNRKNLDKMQEVVIQDIIADLMDVVLKGERDEDGKFSPREIKRLVLYLRGLPAVKVNEELLNKAIAKNNSIVALMDLVRDIGREGEQLGDRIFDIDATDEELQKMVLEDL